MTFESLWTDLISTNSISPSSEPPTSPLLSFLLVNPYDNPDFFTSTNPPPPHIVQFLAGLRPRGLARSARLKRDLGYLTGLHPTDLDVLLAQYPGDKVAEFCAHIRREVSRKPHVLVAYAWCFYMAVFSGGRWIRAQLVNAGDDFWRMGTSDEEREEAVPLSEKGLSFWSFDDDQDGEDIKAKFKDRLAAAEQLFTDDERIDVIEEAKRIFQLSVGLVDELDTKLGTDMESLGQLSRAEGRRPRSHEQDQKTDEVGAEHVTPKTSHSLVMWFRKPEVTGVALALGCLACVALLRLDINVMGDW
jgi:heme oxygenase